MKSKIFSSIKISLIINGLLFMINLFCAYSLHFLPFSKKIAGGDCIEHVGFGIDFLEIMPLSPSEGNNTIYDVKIDVISLIIPIILFFAICLIIKIFIKKR